MVVWVHCRLVWKNGHQWPMISLNKCQLSAMDILIEVLTCEHDRKALLFYLSIILLSFSH